MSEIIHTFSNECFNHQSGDIIVNPQTIFVYKTPRLQSCNKSKGLITSNAF